MILAPDSESLREANDCHTPAGSPRGGQFCSSTGTGSPSFKAWFGASKVVDSGGRPLRVYHGTGGSFDEFDPAVAKSEGGAFFFSHSPLLKDPSANAASYATRAGDGGNIVPVYLRIENPLVTGYATPMPSEASGADAVDKWLEGMERFNRSIDFNKNAYFRREIARARSLGHDGVIFRNVEDEATDYGSWGKETDVYAVFDPRQIKSAIGNRGTWSKRSAKITEAGFREYNRCHDPQSGRFASPVDTPCGEPGDLKTHLPRSIPKVDRNAPYGTEGIKAYTETVIDDKGVKSERLKWYDVRLPNGRTVQLKGEILDDEALRGKLLFHVTGALDAVLKSGKLIAFADGGGLGGGNHPAVSFTASRKDALNILDVMSEFKTAVDLVDGASSDEEAATKFEAHLKSWADRELRALAASKYPPLPGDSPLDRVPMTVLNAAWDGQAGAVKTFRFHLSQGGHRDRGEMAVDALREWLWSRDTAGLGQNPVLFTRAKNLRGKQFGLLAVPARNLPKSAMVNYGADKFQSEVEVHADVPIAGSYFLTRKPRKGAK